MRTRAAATRAGSAALPALRLSAGLAAGQEPPASPPRDEAGVRETVAAEPEEHGRESFFLARAGVGWALELDWVREDHRWDKALVFGVAIGLGF